jgi:hypothetical protein
VRPSRRTEELQHQILEDTFDSVEPVPTPAGDQRLFTNRLDQLRSILTQLSEHVSEDLDALDHALTDPE